MTTNDLPGQEAALERVRDWLRTVWNPATHGLGSDQDLMTFEAPYEQWVSFIAALKAITQEPPEPERHYGTFRVIDGGGMFGEDLS